MFPGGSEVFQSNERTAPMSLITPEIRAALTANGKRHAFTDKHQINNVPPVCWIYDELSHATWLLTEIDRSDPDRAWGLVDAGDGKPDYEPVSLAQLEQCHQHLPLADADITIGAQVLQGWVAKGPLSAYIAAAAKAGRIVDLDLGAVT